MRAAVVATTLIAVLTGCSEQPSEPPAPTPQPTYDHTSIPTTDPEGDQFTLDDRATFPNGLAYQIDTLTHQRATDEIHGADGTEGNVVVATIRVINQSTEPLPGEAIQVWGFYDNVGAPKVVDDTGALGDSFHGEILPGEKVTATMGWAMPADRMSSVTIMIEDNQPGHTPVRFTGPVS